MPISEFPPRPRKPFLLAFDSFLQWYVATMTGFCSPNTEPGAGTSAVHLAPHASCWLQNARTTGVAGVGSYSQGPTLVSIGPSERRSLILNSVGFDCIERTPRA